MILRIIGVWAYSDGEELPWPAQHVDTQWDRVERRLVHDYLEESYVIGVGALDPDPCRICGEPLERGWSYSDGRFVWNSDLPHYVAAHGVRLPSEFVGHICGVVSAARDSEWWKAVAGVGGGQAKLAPPASAALHEIGQWADAEHPDWPQLGQQGRGWDDVDKECVVEFLRTCVGIGDSGAPPAPCQLCGESLEGSRIRSDGVFCWRDDLAHYVERHDVQLPAAVVGRINNIIDADIDWTWWKTAYTAG